MSPEQIAGQEADVRSDIFAFGTVLYESAAGKRAFEGKTPLERSSAPCSTCHRNRSPDKRRMFALTFSLSGLFCMNLQQGSARSKARRRWNGRRHRAVHVTGTDRRTRGGCSL